MSAEWCAKLLAGKRPLRSLTGYRAAGSRHALAQPMIIDVLNGTAEIRHDRGVISFVVNGVHVHGVGNVTRLRWALSAPQAIDFDGVIWWE